MRDITVLYINKSVYTKSQLVVKCPNFISETLNDVIGIGPEIHRRVDF